MSFIQIAEILYKGKMVNLRFVKLLNITKRLVKLLQPLAARFALRSSIAIPFDYAQDRPWGIWEHQKPAQKQIVLLPMHSRKTNFLMVTLIQNAFMRFGRQRLTASAIIISK